MHTYLDLLYFLLFSGPSVSFLRRKSSKIRPSKKLDFSSIHSRIDSRLEKQFRIERTEAINSQKDLQKKYQKREQAWQTGAKISKLEPRSHPIQRKQPIKKKKPKKRYEH
jgi:hypothetical protein